MSRFRTALLLSVSLLIPVAAFAQAPVLRYRISRTANPTPPYGYKVMQMSFANDWQLACDLAPGTQSPGTIRWADPIREGRECEKSDPALFWDWNFQTQYTFTLEAQAVDGEPYSPLSDPAVMLPAWYLPARPVGLKIIPVLPAP